MVSKGLRRWQRQRLSTEPPKAGWPQGYDRIVLDSVDSTNAEAARRAPRLTRPTWILAHAQTAARGRRGRAWVAPPGNFAATLCLKPDAPAQEAVRLSFVAACALRAALWELTQAPGIALKWPNDVLLNDGKVAGILLESAGAPPRLDWMAIGIGVNLRAAPPPNAVEAQALRPVSVFEDCGVKVDPVDLLDLLATNFARYSQTLKTEAGFDAIRTDWLRHAKGLGQTITARLPDREIRGTFDTLDADGCLVLRTETGTERIAAGDVFF